MVILIAILLWKQSKLDVAKTGAPVKMGRLGKVDPNSYAEPEKVVLQHADLDWEIDFNRKIISGSVTLKFKILIEEGVEQIVSSDMRGRVKYFFMTFVIICIATGCKWSENWINFC